MSFLSFINSNLKFYQILPIFNYFHIHTAVCHVRKTNHRRNENANQPDKRDHDTNSARKGMLRRVRVAVLFGDAQVAVERHAEQVQDGGGREEDVADEPDAAGETAEVPVAAEKLDGAQSHCGDGHRQVGYG